MTAQPFLCIGHRGASGHAPENTLLAFEMAVSMGCAWIELDVYCVEKELIVFHDSTLSRTTNGSGEVMAQSLAYLRHLDAGGGQQIPTLREVIHLIDHRVGINIELKGPATAAATNKLLAAFCSHGWQPEEFLISSFNHKELALADPGYRRCVLFCKPSDDYFKPTAELNAYAINLTLKLASHATIKAAHEAGLKVLVYTVNDTATMLRLRDMGVDGVFTNFPDMFPAPVSNGAEYKH